MFYAAGGVEAMEETATVQRGKGGQRGKRKVIATSGHAQLLVSSQREDMPSASTSAAVR